MSPANLAARYRAFAAKCVVVAQNMANASEKLALIDMAQAWIDLADQAEKNGRFFVGYETAEMPPGDAAT
jgi:hypothetical protein